MFGLAKKVFGKTGAAAKVELKKIENRDLMQGICGAALLVAAADGEIENEEIKKLEDIITALPALKHFGSEIHETIQSFKAILDSGFLLGQANILREVVQCKNNAQEAEDIFLVALTIAQADGSIEDKEIEVLLKVARALGVNARDYGFST